MPEQEFQLQLNKQEHQDFHMEHQRKKQEEWEAGQEIMAAVYNGAGVFFSGRLDLAEAFSEGHELSCCIDEGVAHLKTEAEGKMFMAGSGILYPAKSWADRLDRVARLFIKLGVKKVTSHGGCGAAKLAWQRDNPDLDLAKVAKDSFDTYGVEWTRALSVKINELKRDNNLPGEVDYQHIEPQVLVRPKEFHNARVAYFDGTGQFNPDRLTNLPMGFVINYKADSELGETDEEKNYPWTELEVATGIALGNHGFGNKFTTENPFLILAIAEDEDELVKLKTKAEAVAGKYAGRVQVDGFLASR